MRICSFVAGTSGKQYDSFDNIIPHMGAMLIAKSLLRNQAYIVTSFPYTYFLLFPWPQIYLFTLNT